MRSIFSNIFSKEAWQQQGTYHVSRAHTRQSIGKAGTHRHPRLLSPHLHHDDTLSVVCVPDVLQVVDSLAPLEAQERGRLQVRWFDPVGKQVALVGLVPEVLVEVRVADLLQRLDLDHGDEVRVQVHELDGHLLEGALRQKVALDAGESLVRVVVGLLDQPQLLALLLVQADGHGVLLLEALERQDEQLGVVLVRERRERDRAELAALEPVHGGRVDRDGLLRCDVGPVLQVVVLALLLRLQ